MTEKRTRQEETRSLPDDQETQDQSKTEREIERQEEDREIVKRTDESLRHPDDILENAIAEGLEQLERRTLSLFLSAMAAGLILGFTAMSVAVVETWAMSMALDKTSRLATALV